ncbi:putative beta-galactosidase E [Rhizodiscina lignyota]|uniref:Beta-galactosidase n=1 Tax=Rhizodiscina lignyota TaxID=1504668 RepID=A0A9P4M4F8_9PEZI|nr:putative beta-galactosidase E [Rhizodiscina lignyota]
MRVSVLCLLATLFASQIFVDAAVHGRDVVLTKTAQKREPLQDLVTWDEHSLFVRGERVFFYSGEFHPWRIPVPGLWLDVFQKIKAMGFNGVSFYVYWGLIEGNRGHVVTDGIWDYEPFFAAASEAGIYLIARPGPYINAETAAGGFPGWTLRINSTLRSDAPGFIDATRKYVSTISKIIAKAQITNGGPVVMLQPENEYADWPSVNQTDFPEQPQKEYMAVVEQLYRDAGIIVPFIDNDNLVQGSFAPGTGLGSVDLYGIDAYPLRYDCAHPEVWPTIRFPVGWQTLHEEQSPSTPFAIPEFQGGTGTGWGGVDQDMCNALVNMEAVRVMYKNNYSFGVKLLNIYMTFGGTNWGNLGYQGGDSSYDYGAAITEDRHVWREKYSEEKLEAEFFKVSPAYFTTNPGNVSNGSYVSTSAIATTPLWGTNYKTNFYVIRHADFTSLNNTNYKLIVKTSRGKVAIPQLGGDLTLLGRDSKIHVTDYDVGGLNLVYSTGEIYSWQKWNSGKRILLLYGGAGELHEFAFESKAGKPKVSEGSGVKLRQTSSGWTVQWRVTPNRKVVDFGNSLEVHLLWRNDAYNHWIMELPAEAPIGNYSSPSKSSVIIKGGYLLRTAALSGQELRVTGDLNTTTNFELVYEPTGAVQSLSFNGEDVDCEAKSGRLTGSIQFKHPSVSVPDLSKLSWKYLDSLPEVQPNYDDSKWTVCNHKTTTNPILPLLTPTSLYASDYGYHTGSLIYRGHFTANGAESNLYLNVSGGVGFAHSAWLDSTFLGSWIGSGANSTWNQTFDFPSKLQKGKKHIVTVLIDHTGQDEEAPGTDAIKAPRGLLNYQLSGHEQNGVTWKMTGNLGGEQYHDLVRGPRNEGAMYAERQGYHQPSPPSGKWKSASPMKAGIGKAGVGFYTTSFELHVPRGYDVPMSFIFPEPDVNATGSGVYRVQFYVNGYQFGKYVSNLGPQTTYPVPEGILNYDGMNTVALTLWALNKEGARLGSLGLEPQMPVLSGYRKPALSPQPRWSPRAGAY